MFYLWTSEHTHPINWIHASSPCIKSRVVRELLAASGRCPYMSVCCTATTVGLCGADPAAQTLSWRGSCFYFVTCQCTQAVSTSGFRGEALSSLCWRIRPRHTLPLNAPHRQTLFPDPQAVSTFGFRGEALSSLSALAEVSIVTRTEDQVAAARLTYDREGALTGQAAAARAPGTTVAVRDLFKALPVRHKVGDHSGRGAKSSTKSSNNRF